MSPRRNGVLSCSMEPGLYGKPCLPDRRHPISTCPYSALHLQKPDYRDVQILCKQEHRGSLGHHVRFCHRRNSLSVTVNFDGVAVITCVSRLSYAEPVTEEEAAEAGEEPGDEQSGGTDTPEEPVVEDEPAAEEEPADSTPIPYAG